MTALLLGVMAGFMVALPVGAMGILLMETALVIGFRYAIAGAIGIATVDTIYAAIAVIIGEKTRPMIEPWQNHIALAGGLVMAIIGFNKLKESLMNKKIIKPTNASHNMFKVFIKFFFLTLLNPMIIVFFLGFIIAAGESIEDSNTAHIAFIVGVMATSLTWQTILTMIGAYGGNQLEESTQKIISRSGSGLVMIIGVGSMVYGSLRLTGIL